MTNGWVGEMTNTLESDNNAVAYIFELARLVGNDPVDRKRVRLAATNSLRDFHELILRAFSLEDDEVFPGERYADLPYVFYMNNVPEDLTCAYASDNFEAEGNLMDESAAALFSAFTGMPINVGCSLVKKIKQDFVVSSASAPAGLAADAKLQDFAFTAGKQFVYDLGVIPQLTIDVTCLNVEAISNPADACPMILPRRRKKLLR